MGLMRVQFTVEGMKTALVGASGITAPSKGDRYFGTAILIWS